MTVLSDKYKFIQGGVLKLTENKTFEYVTKFLKKYVIVLMCIFFAFSSASCSQTLHNEIINDNKASAKNDTSQTNKVSSEFPDSDGDGRCDNDDPFPDEFNVFYDRQAVRKYAASCADNRDNTDVYPYLSEGITDCANFVSQCIRSGGYEMNDNWYMHRYSDDVPWIRKELDKFSGKLDKGIVLAENNIFNKVAGIMGEDEEIRVTETVFSMGHIYSDGVSSIHIDTIQPMNANDGYVWCNSWSSAEWQIAYGKDHFFSDSQGIEIPVVSKDDVKKNVNNVVDYIHKNNVQVGDLVYLGIEKTIFHVMIITNITDDGKVYLSGHSIGINEALFDESLWRAQGFSDVTIYKVNDVIK